jgi:hypothetical protein
MVLYRGRRVWNSVLTLGFCVLWTNMVLAGSPAPSLIKTGYWAIAVPSANNLLPTSEGHAFAWSDEGKRLMLVDGFGSNVVPNLLPKEERIRGVYRAGVNHAWVVTESDDYLNDAVTVRDGSVITQYYRQKGGSRLYLVDAKARVATEVSLIHALKSLSRLHLRELVSQMERSGRMLDQKHGAFPSSEMPWAYRTWYRPTGQKPALMATYLKKLFEKELSEIRLDFEKELRFAVLSYQGGELASVELRLIEDGRSLWLILWEEKDTAIAYHFDVHTGRLLRATGPQDIGAIFPLALSSKSLIVAQDGLYLAEPGDLALSTQRIQTEPAIRITRNSSDEKFSVVTQLGARYWNGYGWKGLGSGIAEAYPGVGTDAWVLSTSGELSWESGDSADDKKLEQRRLKTLDDLLFPASYGRAWLKAESEVGIESVVVTETGLTIGPSILMSPGVGKITKLYTGDVAWISTSDDYRNSAYIVRDARDIKGVVLSWGGQQIALKQPQALNSQQPVEKAPILRLADDLTQVDVKFQWQGLASVVPNQGRIYFEVFQGEKIVASASGDMAPSLALALRWVTPPSAGTYAVSLRYTDALGSNLEMRWPHVEIQSSWAENPKVRTLLLYGILLLFAGLLLRLRLRNYALLRRWGPLMVFMLGSSTNLGTFAQAMKIDGALLMKLLFGTVLVGLLVGFVSVDVFRLFAQTAPFDKFVPLMLGRRTIRRRFFAAYLSEFKERLDGDASGAHQEKYLPLPARIMSFDGLSDGKDVKQPVDTLIEQLTTAGEQGAVVYVEAPGGRGKSALIRAVLYQAIERFRRDGSVLPVLCTVRKGITLPLAIERALGQHFLSATALAQQMEAGQLLIAVDGLSESGLLPEELQTFLSSEGGGATALLLGTRPSRGLRKVVSTRRRAIFVEPCRLDDSTLEQFEKHYLAIDLAMGRFSPSRLSKELRGMCRARDGSYAPILVRLAVRVGSASVRGIAEIYERTFRVLLRRVNGLDSDEDTELLDEVAVHCRNTYWKYGYRALAFSAEPETRRRPLQRLLEAGILVPADRAERVDILPPQVKFFHDSMQSYLTARGLFAQGDWDVLFEAAGSPKFFEFNESGNRSELFQMCALVFAPTERLRDQLRDQLYQWSRDVEVDRDLRKADVLRGLALDLHPKLAGRVGVDESASAMLRKAVEVCLEAAGPGVPDDLIMLYQQIAPIAWKALTTPSKNTDSSVNIDQSLSETKQVQQG